MPLSAGTHLGSYEITAAIGAGGMGEVYQARDTNLGRDVAIKVLPEPVAADPDRLARLEREARTLAALDHPHIAKIHGVERSQGVYALVMELVAGRDLSDLLAAGPMSVSDTLAIARQIADALEAAHEAGIIHRDLKPANVKVRDDGTVKVLDFGLAKAMDPAGTTSTSVSQSPTLTTPAMTAMGMILGTAAYMSPEQAKGRPADKRSDIWSFGCVLYEMLTGRRAYPGEDVSETLASVLAREPDFSKLPAGLSPAIRTLVERCLVKDRRQRLGDIAAVHLLLNESIGPTLTSGAVPVPALPARGGTRERLVWGGALAVVAAIAIAGWWLRPAAVAPPEYRLQIVTPPSVNPTAFALSPDGRMVAYWAVVSGKTQLWLQHLDNETATLLPGTEMNLGSSLGPPFWSPDSRSVGFMASGKLRRVDMAGGSMQALADVTNNAYGGAWGADDTIVYTPGNSSALLRVSASRGRAAAATTLAPDQASHRFPAFLPDGRHFLFFVTGTAAVQGVYIGSIDSPESHRLFDSDFAAAFLAPDLALFRRDEALVAQRLDLETFRPVGGSFTVAPLVSTDSITYAALGVSAAREGTFAYRPPAVIARQLEWFDRTGRPTGTVGDPDTALEDLYPRLSPDGQWATVRRRVDGNADVWLVDTMRGSRRQVTTNAAVDGAGAWSPHGDRLAFHSQRLHGGGVHDLFIRTMTGAGTETPVLESRENKNILDWSPDGRVILYRIQSSTTSDDIWALPLDGDRPGKPVPLVVTPKSESVARFSPDGQWIAYQSAASGSLEVLVQPYPSGAATQVSKGGGGAPRWGRNGREVVYLAPDGQVMAVPVTLGPAGRVDAGTPASLFRLRPTATFDVTSDGQRFLVNTPLEDAPTPPITVVLNWKGR